MTGPPDHQPWLDKADRDLRTAQLVIGDDPPMPDLGCYHAQQAVEKWLKALLVARRRAFRPVHDLVYLTQLCAQEEPAFAELIPAADQLNEFAVGVRYPEGGQDPTESDAERSFQQATRFRDLVLRCVGRASDRDDP